VDAAAGRLSTSPTRCSCPAGRSSVSSSSRDAAGLIIRQTAQFDPAGLRGLAYRVHQLIVGSMLRGIGERVRRGARPSWSPAPPGHVPHEDEARPILRFVWQEYRRPGRYNDCGVPDGICPQGTTFLVEGRAAA